MGTYSKFCKWFRLSISVIWLSYSSSSTNRVSVSKFSIFFNRFHRKNSRSSFTIRSRCSILPMRAWFKSSSSHSGSMVMTSSIFVIVGPSFVATVPSSLSTTNCNWSVSSLSPCVFSSPSGVFDESLVCFAIFYIKRENYNF